MIDYIFITAHINYNLFANIFSAIQIDDHHQHQHQSKSHLLRTTFIIDLNSKKDFLIFIAQIMDLSMIQSKFHFILTYMSIHELNLNNFQHGGVRITGFSIIDYNNINTIKKISEMIQNEQPLNKLPYISVKPILNIMMNRKNRNTRCYDL